MIDTLYDIRDYVRDNLTLVLAVGMIIILITGNFLFFNTAIRPNLQARNDLAEQVLAARETLTQNQLNQEDVPDQLQAQINNTQRKLEEVVGVFMTETQAVDALNNLYLIADQTGVEVMDLQSQEPPVAAIENMYDVRAFQLRVDGEVAGLLAFMNQIKEAKAPSFAIDNVKITESEIEEVSRSTLTMDIVLYTSPFALETAVTEIPDLTIPTPAATAVSGPDIALLEKQLDEQWAEEDWPAVINILEQILVADPDNVEMRQKMYAAHVNYGYQLASQPNYAAARIAFEQALAVDPEGDEALAGKELVTLLPQLDSLWPSNNWPETIRLIEQILALDPGREGMLSKLYAAHVNYGYQLAEQQPDAALAQFEEALSIQPNGAEALDGIRSLGISADPPPSDITYYTVRRGDTLYSLARRFGTTVEALKAANGLPDNKIVVNQRLRIP